MDYEELYGQLQPLEKDLKDVANLIQRMYKSIVKDTESGNLRNIAKCIETLRDSVGTLSERAEAIGNCIDGFDTEAYFASGRFAEQMLACCKEEGVDVIGESPIFEMFPYRVRIDADNQDIFLDRKKLPTMRPLYVAQTVGKSRERMLKAKFNAQRFADELADAYDMTILKMNKRSGADLYLTAIYKTLVPMGQFRRDYDQHNFAFDIARLYGSEVEATKKGRRWQFGPSKNNSKAIRILDAEGNEQFLATIKFFDAEESL